jgi:hypothetical protein
MSSVRTGSLLSALVGGLLSASACNKSFAPIPVVGAGGFVGSQGGSSGSPGTRGVAGAAGALVDGGSRPVLDGGSGPLLDGGSAARDTGPLPHCASVVPTGPVIADFDDFNDQAFGIFGVDPVVGGTFVDPPGSLVEDFSDGNWHLTGTVSGPVSFGFNWKCPGVIDGVCALDLSRNAGIHLTLDGNIGSPGIILLTMGTATDEVARPPFGCGTCVPNGIATCTDPFAAVAPGSIVSPALPVNVTWNFVEDGDPFATLDPGRVTGIAFTLPSATDGSSYSVDFTLDDIRLIPIPR